MTAEIDAVKSEKMTPQNIEMAMKLQSLSEVLLEHIMDFDGKLDEVMLNFEASIEQMVEKKVAERVEHRLKELGHA